VDDAQELATWTEVLPLGDLLVRSATLYPERDAIVFPDSRYTFSEVLERATSVARGLLAVGVQPRQHVGLLAHNQIEFIEGLFGVALAGAVVVPINARHKTSELAYIIENADLVALLTTGPEEGAYIDFSELITEALPTVANAADASSLELAEAPQLRSIVTLRGGDRHGFLSRRSFDELAAGVQLADLHRARSTAVVRDPAMILYTSGTTANPKGCVLSHEAVVRGPLHRAKHRFGRGEADVTWGAGPLFHVGSLSPFIGSIGAGGTYLTDVTFHPGRAIELMVQERATVAFPWFPAIMQPLLDHPTFDPTALDQLRSILVIGPRVLIEKVQRTFPQAEMVAACGMTETAGIYALSDRVETTEDRSEAQGKAAPGIELRIADPETGQDLPDGETGEILIRGYCVMTEYYKDPEKTSAALDPDGWLHTSDLYSRTPDGRLVFHGRLKDMLKVGGENVAAIEVESFLCTHPSVRMASVVGRPDARLDEVPVAFVELERGGVLTGEELIAYCQGKISRYKIPVEVHFVEPDDWPMSTTKIDKRGLRARIEQAPIA
jgi:fatty-acyl-CoA synthase/long-chain acyl-CoA synthetase